ncbi:helix-turn-helix domain-containing protein [Collimonas pratensis]|uniref:helix-turn-helix domain-containing protein n=1 Tax=Collimonas pratensis TaxID=279113 RepID=UPI00142FBABC|nr:helix-turn-helix transcriptional regulator [Collimonas pratensis]
MSFNANCGDRLREERDRLGFTQQEMAERMGVRREMSSKYERAQAVPGGDALSAFAAVGGDVQYVLTGQRSNSAMSPDEKELLAGYRSLDIRGKANMLGMLDVVGETQNAAQRNTAVPRVGSVQFHGEVGQHIVGDITAPQTINVGGGKKTKKPKKNLDE